MSNQTTYAYDLSGNIVQKTLPNGLKEVRTHDGRNRVSTLRNQNSAGADIAGYAYQYDAVGNVMEVAEDYPAGDLPGRTITNSYDGIYRLLTEEIATSGGSTVTTEYGYDANGNRSSRTVPFLTTTGDTTSASTTLSGLASTTGVTIGMVVSGTGIPSSATVIGLVSSSSVTLSVAATATGSGISITFGNTDTYSYDDENRLIGLDYQTGESGTGTYAYGYDYRTRRVARTEPGPIRTHIVFDGGVSIIEYGTGGAASPSVEYVRGHDYGGGVGGLEYSVRNGTASFNFYDSRGDVTTQTDIGGTPTYQTAYEAFGSQTATSGSTLDRQKANTKEQDPTGLLNEGFRYRDPETGTFLTRDPLGFKAGPNMYTYVRQNPWTHFDPEGLDWKTSAAGGLKAIGGMFEVAVGASMAIAGVGASELGVGIPVALGGGAIALHGVDTVQSGYRQAVSVQQVNSLTSTGLQKAGMSKTAANVTDAVIGVVGSAGAGVATGLTKVAVIKATDSAAAGMTSSQVISATETGSKALPNAVFDKLGGAATTPLAKAAMIKSGQVAGTGGVNIGKATTLAGTGLTPGADIGAGVGAAATQAAAAAMTGTSGSNQTSTPSSSARATAPPPQSPPPPTPSVKQ